MDLGPDFWCLSGVSRRPKVGLDAKARRVPGGGVASGVSLLGVSRRGGGMRSGAKVGVVGVEAL